jgi:hypothetical protein
MGTVPSATGVDLDTPVWEPDGLAITEVIWSPISPEGLLIMEEAPVIWDV